MKRIMIAAIFAMAGPAFANGPTPAPEPIYSCSNGMPVSHPGKCGNGPVTISNAASAVSTAQAIASTGAVNIDNNARSSASAAIAAPLPGYGLPNCFGDTNPSGQFTAAFGNRILGASSASIKASNVCAAYAIGGPALALEYLQRMDRNMPRSIALPGASRVTCPASHPVYVQGRGCRK